MLQWACEENWIRCREREWLVNGDWCSSGRASEGRERYRDANSTERLTRREPESGPTGGSEFMIYDWDNDWW